MRNIQTVYQNKSSNKIMSFWLLAAMDSDILTWYKLSIYLFP